MDKIKQKLSELKKYENIKKKHVKKLIIFLKSKKKSETLRQKGAYKIVFRYLNPSYYIKANNKKNQCKQIFFLKL